MNIDSEEVSKSLGDYIAVLKRRKKIIAIVACAVFLIGLIVAFVWPSTYRSTAVILIESQDIPPDLVRSTITSYAVQRIEEIKQRIMTTANIMGVVERFELYNKDQLKRLTRTEISNKFRENVSVEPISADVRDPRSGNPTKAVIAFKLAFNGHEPQKVHKVTNELITLYLNENLRGRTEQSNSTSDFLSGELSELDKILKDLEEKLSKFKAENKGSLPELNGFNLNILDRSESELADVKTRIQDLESRKISIGAQLAQLNPSAPTIMANGQAVLSDSDRLKALQSEYRRKSSIYNGDHPDLIRLNREITALSKNLGLPEEAKDISRQLQIARDQLAQSREKYTAQHPEIKRLSELVVALEKEVPQEKPALYESVPDNPSYVLLDTQLKAVDSEILALKSKLNIIREKINTHEKLLLKAPTVERDYQVLLRDYENTRLKYREISEKQMQATLGKNLELERKGERFTLIQPPEIPEEPVSLNRLVIVFAALMSAVGLGVIAGIIAEGLDQRVYGESSINAITGLNNIVVIPFYAEPVDRIVQAKQYRWIVGCAFFSLLVGALLFNFLVKPLDVTFYILLNRLGLNS